MDIVLIPGVLATPKLWYHQEKHLNGKVNFHHVNVLNSHSITEMAQRFAQNSPDKFTLVGFSMGGCIALELFRYIPHKIDKLILINSSEKSICTNSKTDRERSISIIQRGKFSFLLERIIKQSIFDPIKAKTLLPFLTAMAQEIGPTNYINQLFAIIHRQDQSKLLSTIECPTLLLASKNDHVVSNDRAQQMAKNIGNAELVYIEDLAKFNERSNFLGC